MSFRGPRLSTLAIVANLGSSPIGRTANGTLTSLQQLVVTERGEQCLSNRLRGSKRDASDGKNEPSELPMWLGPAQVIDFVVAMAGEVYDAHEQEVQIGTSGFYRREHRIESSSYSRTASSPSDWRRTGDLNGSQITGSVRAKTS
jgi:hypothetical protein